MTRVRTAECIDVLKSCSVCDKPIVMYNNMPDKARKDRLFTLMNDDDGDEPPFIVLKCGPGRDDYDHMCRDCWACAKPFVQYGGGALLAREDPHENILG